MRLVRTDLEERQMLTIRRLVRVDSTALYARSCVNIWKAQHPHNIYAHSIGTERESSTATMNHFFSLGRTYGQGFELVQLEENGASHNHHIAALSQLEHVTTLLLA